MHMYSFRQKTDITLETLNTTGQAVNEAPLDSKAWPRRVGTDGAGDEASIA